MRSLVAEIFHSLSRNSILASSENSSSWGPSTTRIGPEVAGSSIRRSATPLAIFDGEIAEGASLGEADRKRFTVPDGHRGIHRHGPSGDVGTTWGARQRNVDR